MISTDSTYRTISVDGSGQDGMFVWWEPGPISVSDLQTALTAAGCSAMMPKTSNAPAALKTTLSRFISAAKIKVRGNPIDINPLREDIRGFEAVKQDRGDTDNFHDFVMSVVEESGSIKIAKYNPAYVPQVDVIRNEIERQLTASFQSELNWIPTSMATSCLGRVVLHLGGIVVRKAGGIYFLPESASSRFEPLADAIDRADGKLQVTITRFPLKPSERSYRLVLTSIREEIHRELMQIEEALANLGGRKQRSDAQSSRLIALDEMSAKVTRYESLLGVALQDVHDAVEKVKGAVAARNVMDMCV